MPAALSGSKRRAPAASDVTANQYPYTRASNDLDSCLPLWVREAPTTR